jgi:rubrerythrin
VRSTAPVSFHEERVEANELIRDWAREREDDSLWEFVCECDDPECTRRTKVTLDLYDAVRRSDGQILAQPHPYERARAARAEAAELREESRAVRAQAAHQLRRTRKLRRYGFEPIICKHCGYAVAIRKPPSLCPMCGRDSWRS